MRILFVNQYYPPDAAATAYLLGELSEDLAQDHEVWVVAGRPSYNPEATTFKPHGVRVLRAISTSFRRQSIGGRLANYGSFLMSSLARAQTVPRPDVVVAMTDPPVVGLVGLLTARRHGVPFVYVCEDIFPDVAVALGRMNAPTTVRGLRRLNQTLRSGADRIVAIGRDMVAKLEAEGVPTEKIVFLPNWASTLPSDPELRRQTRRQLGWEKRFVVMHAGNVGLAQNLSTLIAAAELLKSEGEVHIAMVGDGAARTALEGDVRSRQLSNVGFHDYLPKHQAQALLAAADVHIISLKPGLLGCVVPSKLYNIMAVGRPFIAAVELGSEPALILEEHDCGVRVGPGDPQQLAEAILNMRKTPLEEMGRRGREAFERLYDRPIATAKYRRLLEEVAAVGG